MKLKVLSLLLASAGLSFGTVSITLSNTTNVLTNLVVNAADPGTQRLVWGVIIDSSGDGFLGGDYLGWETGDLTGPATKTGGQILSTTDGATDDILYLATAVFSTSGTANGSTGLARPLSLTNIALSGNVGFNDAFAIVWFDLDNVDLGGTSITATANTTVPWLTAGTKYGMLTTSGAIAQTLPLDGQGKDLTTNFSANPDPKRATEFTLATAVPEPSAALLGGLGLLGLLRRRRN